MFSAATQSKDSHCTAFVQPAARRAFLILHVHGGLLGLYPSHFKMTYLVIHVGLYAHYIHIVMTCQVIPARNFKKYYPQWLDKPFLNSYTIAKGGD